MRRRLWCRISKGAPMFQKRLALSVPLDGFTLAEHVEISKEMERRGYTDAWSFEVDGIDCFSPLATIALSTNMRIGTAIANVYTRGPATLAQCAAGIAELAPGRFIFGIGSGSQPIIEMWNSGKFARPATRVREVALFLRQALAGERVVFDGETFKVNGFRLSRVPSQPIPLQVAALRGGMLKVAGEVADGAIINWLSADDCRKSVKVVRDAAAAAGRDPEAIEITARLMINIDGRTPEADAVVRRAINAYLNVPVYKEFHRWLGRTEQLAPMWNAWESGDRKAALAAVPTKVMDDLMVRGDWDEIRDHIRRYHEAGVDTAFLSLNTMEQDPAVKREKLLEAHRMLAPDMVMR
ncbi:MAG: LLM class F420-dependent oxidoreductase [Solimonas sp.]